MKEQCEKVMGVIRVNNIDGSSDDFGQRAKII